MRILAFETTGAHASVACADAEGNIFEKSSEGVLNHLQSLMPMTEALLIQNGISLKDISCVAASAGPGSFTGIRIGVSSARALAQAMGVPCIGAPTLQSFLFNIDGYDGIVCPILDARRGEVYGGAFRFVETDGGVEEIEEIVAGGAYPIEKYLDILKAGLTDAYNGRVMFFGDGLPLHADGIERWGLESLAPAVRLEFAEDGKRLQTASSVAKLALKLYDEGKQVEYAKLLPAYMRRAEAERKLEAGRLTFKR